ncbi:hypothetical protein V5O48_015398 [Marasmius crinis-equi]|uniref:Uncharacterized protein n=1 Tax=Marasmius crinis-equi TaxID=585013 RepID=A0ABR3EUN5_9AGAR
MSGAFRGEFTVTPTATGEFTLDAIEVFRELSSGIMRVTELQAIAVTAPPNEGPQSPTRR